MIFNHHRLKRGYFRDLMAVRLRVFPLQSGATPAALVRLNRDHFINLLDRFQQSNVMLMPRLSASFALTFLG